MEIADHLRMPYDIDHDYHPQFDGYAIGTRIKQADAILIGYPLMFPMNASTRSNDLSLYSNVTRNDGPAMTYSLTVINYLEIDETNEAQKILARSYQPYLRAPFNVWNEVVANGTGATNFITGAGGFLQTIFNGYLGLRYHLDRLEIIKPKLPLVNVTRIYVRGFTYLSSKFSLKVEREHKSLMFYELADELKLMMVTKQMGEFDVKRNVECE